MYDLLDSSSSSSLSDSEDELDVLLLELATTPRPELGPHVSLDDMSEISEIDCKLLFRYINRDRVVLEMVVFCKLFQLLLRVFFLFISCTTCQLVPFTDLKRPIIHASRVLYNYQDITYVEMACVPQPWRLY